jgi:hypothetical protein
MSVNAIPMAKKNQSEQLENDLGKELKSSKITSEIDFLKRMKLKAQLFKETTAGSKEGDALRNIASFQSSDDKRIQVVYSKLIVLYKAAEAEKETEEGKPEAEKAGVGRVARNEMSNIYSQFGYHDLYHIASVISEIQRVKTENADIMSSVRKILV